MTAGAQARRERAEQRPILDDLPRSRLGLAMNLWFLGLALAIILPFLICLLAGAWHLDDEAIWPGAAMLLFIPQVCLLRCAVFADPRMPAVIVRNRLFTWVVPWDAIVDVDVKPGHLKQKGTTIPITSSLRLILDNGQAIHCVSLRYGGSGGSRAFRMCSALLDMRARVVGPVDGDAAFRAGHGRVWPHPPWTPAQWKVRRQAAVPASAG